MESGAPTEQRGIDVPLEDLPEIDEHSVIVRAPQEVVWDAVVATIHAPGGKASERVAEALGCDDTEASGAAGAIGSTVPGFTLVRVVKPAVLALEGRHRFSVYGLIFKLEPTKDDRTLLRAETRARFPGLVGQVYKTLVIRTRGHVLAVNRILRAVRRRAERQH
jgi:hypothetical protein